MDASTPQRPEPGIVVNTRWGPYATCRQCGDFSAVSQRGLLMPHDKPRGDGPCPNRWTAPDLKTAIARDNQLTDDEDAAKAAAYRWCIQCKGYQVLTDGSVEPCWHPICRAREHEGLHWTLMGWRKADQQPATLF